MFIRSWFTSHRIAFWIFSYKTGQFTGLGIEIGYRGGFIAILTPIDGSPAIEAGLQAGDVILKIDGTSTQGMSTSESSTYMRGAKGTDVTLEIGRAGESQPFDVVVTRGE